MGNLEINKGLIGAANHRLSHLSTWILLLCLAVFIGEANAGRTPKAEFKTYDMMGFEFVPEQFRDKKLEQIPVLYECDMFRGSQTPVNCDDIDRSESNDNIVRWRAWQMIGVPVVAIDIEATVWSFHELDLDIVAGAVERWQHLIDVWREVNPDTTILIYGPVPKIHWALMTENYELIAFYEAQAAIVAPLFRNPLVEAWPSGYVNTDNPDIYRAERQWQIDICHRVLYTKCYFSIQPHFRDYIDSGTGQQIPMDQNSFLEIMTTLKEDGADGFGLWINRQHLPADFEDLMKDWSWHGGVHHWTVMDKNVLWLSAVEKFLNARLLKDSGKPGKPGKPGRN